MRQIEEWKDVVGFEGFYKVSNIGNVKSIDRYVNHWQCGKCIKYGKNLKPKISHKGYCMVSLQLNGDGSLKSIHRLVAIAFIPNPDNKEQVNHINGDKTDNRVENLEWCTQSENQIHAFSNGLNKGSMYGRKGHLHPRKKTSKADDIEIKKCFMEGSKIQELAYRYSISRKTIQRVIGNIHTQDGGQEG